MKEDLAQKLLTNVMKWDAEKLNQERFFIQLLADIKYDYYQRYTHGMRYIESLALWLRNFDSEEREKMYDFVKNNLIFISEEQMRHLVENVYDFYVVPLLLKKSKRNKGNKKNQSIEQNREVFNKMLKTSLFFGLSDGSHIDVFRRANENLSHEAIAIYYDISEEKFKEMLDNAGGGNGGNISIFLLDDFSGSGISFIRKEGEDWKGKIVSFMEKLKKYNILLDGADIHIILYVSTKNAVGYINNQLTAYKIDKKIENCCFEANAIQFINPIEIDEELSGVLKKYYRLHSMNRIENEHYAKGNTDEPHMGFNNGRLPLVLYHNTPNNTFPIIWFNNEYSRDFNALFPRVNRHKGGV